MVDTSRLDKWLKDHVCGDVKVELRDCFCYFYNEKVIAIPVMEYDDDAVNEALFIESVRRAGLRADYSQVPYLAISMLHEIGHHMTFHFYNEEDVAEYELEEGRIRNIIQIENVDSEAYKTAQFEYFNLPIELDATIWAVEFANDYPNFVWELEDILGNLIEEGLKDWDTLVNLYSIFFMEEEKDENLE